MRTPNSQPEEVLFWPASAAKARVREAGLCTEVVCGTDFSATALEAGQAAAALADRVLLVHAADKLFWKRFPVSCWRELGKMINTRLLGERDLLASLHMASVQSSLRSGPPAAMLLEEANAHKAVLLIMGMPLRHDSHLWPRATIPEQLAECARIPTLMVCKAAPFLEWVHGDRRLRVLVAVDLAGSSVNALRWIDSLRRAGPCDVIAAHLAADWIPAGRRVATVPSLFMDEMVLKAPHARRRYFDYYVRTRFGTGHVHTKVKEDSGESGSKLIGMAAQEKADLIVLGTHSRRGWHRLGHHSVSREILRHAPMNVLVCPMGESS